MLQLNGIEKKRTFKRKILCVLLGMVRLGALGAFCGTLYLKHQFFRDRPNALSFEGELQSVPFEWSEQTYDRYTKPFSAILIPVSFPGLSNNFDMQFETGTPFTQLRSRCLELSTSQSRDRAKDKSGNLVPLEEIFGHQAVAEMKVEERNWRWDFHSVNTHWVDLFTLSPGSVRTFPRQPFDIASTDVRRISRIFR